MADVFGAEVRRRAVANSAALGAALRALHADRLGSAREMTWDTVVGGLDQATPETVRPTTAHQAVYRDLLPRYAAFERRAVGSMLGPSGRQGEGST
jgi:sugar (pentulose or hexulose) kinase